MGMNATAAADLIGIITGDGEDITITSPAGVSTAFKAMTQDIHLMVDPGTAQVVSSRQCTVAIPISFLNAAGFSAISGVTSRTAKPWLVSWQNVNGVTIILKVIETHPDAGVGLMILRLGAYKETP